MYVCPSQIHHSRIWLWKPSYFRNVTMWKTVYLRIVGKYVNKSSSYSTCSFWWWLVEFSESRDVGRREGEFINELEEGVWYADWTEIANNKK